jgi:hypothetical protein
LTGTPIQNKLEDVGALLAFARISGLENLAVFRKHVVNPFKEDSDTAVQRLAHLLDCVCLRRTQELLNLPNLTEQTCFIVLSEGERKSYDNNLKAMKREISNRVGRREERSKHFGIFQAQLQLRLLCNHGTWQKPFVESMVADGDILREDAMFSLGQHAQIPCSECGIPIPAFDTVHTSNSLGNCPHSYCPDCIARLQVVQNVNGGTWQITCSLCFPTGTGTVPMRGSRTKDVQIRGDYFLPTGTSSKIETLLHDLPPKGSGEKR